MHSSVLANKKNVSQEKFHHLPSVSPLGGIVRGLTCDDQCDDQCVDQCDDHTAIREKLSKKGFSTRKNKNGLAAGGKHIKTLNFWLDYED